MIVSHRQGPLSCCCDKLLLCCLSCPFLACLLPKTRNHHHCRYPVLTKGICVGMTMIHVVVVVKKQNPSPSNPTFDLQLRHLPLLSEWQLKKNINKGLCMHQHQMQMEAGGGYIACCIPELSGRLEEVQTAEGSLSVSLSTRSIPSPPGWEEDGAV